MRKYDVDTGKLTRWRSGLVTLAWSYLFDQ